MEQFYIRLYNYKVENKKKKTIIIGSIIIVMIVGLIIFFPKAYAKRYLNYYTTLIQKAYVEVSLEAIENKEEPIIIDRKELLAKGLRVKTSDIDCDPCVVTDRANKHEYNGYKNYQIIIDNKNHSITLKDIKNDLEKTFYVDEKVQLN